MSELPLEAVNHPDHYQSGGLEVIDILEKKLSAEEYDGFLLGNILKYLLRWRFKNGVQDLKKAHWYLSRWIAKLENGDDSNQEVLQ